MRLELCLFNIIFIQSRLGFGFFLCVFADKPFHPLPVLQNVTCPTTSFTDLAEIVSRIEPVKAPVADGEWGQGQRQRQLLPCSGRGLSLSGPFPAPLRAPEPVSPSCHLSWHRELSGDVTAVARHCCQPLPGGNNPCSERRNTSGSSGSILWGCPVPLWWLHARPVLGWRC